MKVPADTFADHAKATMTCFGCVRENTFLIIFATAAKLTAKYFGTIGL